ncbi:hypothetical protein QTP81_04205 [Alteromonas sp. ASW11-36]|uniref:Uncharacterized protein n=1 Tax=Alteromonas arenosi TaxID=3055817 RepID=A0ABT7SW60_9ALTE|nr:hypothetical protein [Alteromonas sp. ASW11-36]MDM7859802.1 hypothetical protein [Alteromonas sp. ASW11-36]
MNKIERLYNQLYAVDKDLPQLVVTLLKRCNQPVCTCRENTQTVAQFVAHMREKQLQSNKSLHDLLNSLNANPNLCALQEQKELIEARRENKTPKQADDGNA